MKKSLKSTASEQFTLSQKKARTFIKEKDKAEQERADKTARLKALRLAKATSDRKK
ncbi:MAG: hypothetical protein K9G33_01740 [Sneathiella sp.]|nr:hypothetical protein [Sneathiella sp.]